MWSSSSARRWLLLSGPDAPQIDFEGDHAGRVRAINAGNLPGAVQSSGLGLSPAHPDQPGAVHPEFQAFVIDKVGSVLGAVPEILRQAAGEQWSGSTSSR